MLANALLVLGVVCLLLGGWLKFRNGPATNVRTQEASILPDSKAKSTSVDPNYEKGYAFEQWMADRFDRGVYKVKRWRSDKRSVSGVYPEDSGDPDLEIDFVMGTERAVLAVECKYRERLLRTFELKRTQLERYRNYAQQNGREVFLALGVGGSPSAPEHLYMVPLREVRSETMRYEQLLQYAQKVSTNTFYYDVRTQRLTLYGTARK
jgi:Holliday junction resolvase